MTILFFESNDIKIFSLLIISPLNWLCSVNPIYSIGYKSFLISLTLSYFVPFKSFVDWFKYKTFVPLSITVIISDCDTGLFPSKESDLMYKIDSL